jgi:hypothetical protein
MEVLKLCGALGVDACELGAPILSEGMAEAYQRTSSADVGTSAGFYRALGIPLFENNEPRYAHHVDGGIGDSAVQLFPCRDCPISRVQLGFRVTSIDEVAAALDGLDISHQLP